MAQFQATVLQPGRRYESRTDPPWSVELTAEHLSQVLGSFDQPVRLVRNHSKRPVGVIGEVSGLRMVGGELVAVVEATAPLGNVAYGEPELEQTDNGLTLTKVHVVPRPQPFPRREQTRFTECRTATV